MKGGWHGLYGNMCEGARVVAHGIFSVVSGVVGKEKEKVNMRMERS